MFRFRFDDWFYAAAARVGRIQRVASCVICLVVLALLAANLNLALG